MADTMRGAPQDWREVLAPFCPALRANLGQMPRHGRPLPAIEIDEDGVRIVVMVPDTANRALHHYEFDEFPTDGELAACVGAMYAPHN